MIVKFAKMGQSFKGVTLYLGHDIGRATSDRVSFTHTFSLANDHIGSAVNEMLMVYRDRNLLKEAAGVRAGRNSTKPVMHISLAWHPDEHPSKAAMIAAAESFRKHMGLNEHQTILFAHSDRPHPHLHLVINSISPVDGRKYDDGHLHHRAQKWAAEFEKEQGKIYCAARFQ